MGVMGGSVLVTSHRTHEVDLKMPSQVETPIGQDVKDADP